jgi:conjugative relaxase-like TrwC/TraI family protein
VTKQVPTQHHDHNQRTKKEFTHLHPDPVGIPHTLDDHAGVDLGWCGVLSVWAGNNPRYLLDQVAAGREGYYTDAVTAGEPPGRWFGRAARVLGLTGEVDSELMEAIYTHGLDPRDARSRRRNTWRVAPRLGRPPKRYRSAGQIYEALLAEHPDATPELRAQLQLRAQQLAKHPVLFEDVTYSAPKSVSVLWAGCERRANQARAAGHREQAQLWAARAARVEQAVEAGARAAIAYLEAHAGYGRVGHHGGEAGQWIDAHQWVVAQFLQHDSRDRDPQLHVHSAILNKQLCVDGQWRALDTAAIRLHLPAAAAVASRTMETMLTQQLGVEWVSRSDGVAREIVGVPAEVCAAFASRRRAVSAAAAAAIREFEQTRGRTAPLWVRHRLTQMACLRTRAPKSHKGVRTEQRSQDWDARLRRELDATLGGIADTVFATRRDPGSVRWELRDLTQRVFARLNQRRGAKWSRADVILAVSDELPAHLGGSVQQLPRLLERVAEDVLRSAVRLTPPEPTMDLPPELLLTDGSSAYQRPGAGWWADPATMYAEQALRAAAATQGVAVCTTQHARAVLTEYARGGCELGADQRAALLGITTSGAQLQVLTAPAGAGKSTLVGAIARVWANTGHRVIGLATSEAAAAVLRDEGLDATNISRWLTQDSPLELGDLVVIDEASMTPTMDLLAVQQRCATVGARMLLVGDPAQLGAVGAGGMLADLITRAPTYELTEVRRFHTGWEGPASLRLRDGDLNAVLDYATHGRLIDGGTPTDTESAAVSAWLADTLAGRDALLITATTEEAARVSALARAELVHLGRVAEHGVWLDHCGAICGVGDIITTRRNGWELRNQVGWVPINRDRYRVVATHDDGALTVVPLNDPGARPRVLPAQYVTRDVELGYAVTAHCAQGRSVDTAHAILRPGISRDIVYVALTRGRLGNWAYCVTSPDPPEPAVGDTQVQLTAQGVLETILTPSEDAGNSAAYDSVLATHHRATDRACSIMRCVDRLAAELDTATVTWVAGLLDVLATTGALSNRQRCALAADRDSTRELGWLLHAAMRAGHDPTTLLRDALTERDWVGVVRMGPVLRARIRTQLPTSLPPLISMTDLVPDGLRSHPRFAALTAAADTRRRLLGERVATTPPLWALRHLGWVPTDPAARDEWIHRAGWIAAARDLTSWDDPLIPLGVRPTTQWAQPHHLVWHTAQAALTATSGESITDEAGSTHDQHPQPHIKAITVHHALRSTPKLTNRTHQLHRITRRGPQQRAYDTHHDIGHDAELSVG